MSHTPATPSPVYTLAHQIGVRLRARGWTLAVAESCTGGLLGDSITDVPGSSDYFLGGVQAYSNAVKQRLLGVQDDTLARHGAVSAVCAAEMATGVRILLGADTALSITGVAGPGQSEAKPQGLTFIHLATPTGERGFQAQWTGDRRENKQASALAALRLLHDYLNQP